MSIKSGTPWDQKIVKEAAGSGEGIRLRDTVTLTVVEGKCQLTYTATIVGDHDYVGLYVNPFLPQGDRLQWNWCHGGGSFPYNTGVPAREGLVAIYWSLNVSTGEYDRVCYSDPLPANFVNGTSVSGSSN